MRKWSDTSCFPDFPSVDEKNFVRRRNLFQLRTKFFSSADEIQFDCGASYGWFAFRQPYGKLPLLMFPNV